MSMFIRSCRIGFQSNCIILYPHQQWMSVSIVLHPHKHLVVLVFWILTILIIVYRYLTFVLIFSSPVIYDMDYILYAYLPSVYLLWATYSGILPIFKSNCSFFNCWFLRILCTFQIVLLYLMYLLQIFSCNLWLVYLFSWLSFTEQKIFNFGETWLTDSFTESCLWYYTWNSVP